MSGGIGAGFGGVGAIKIGGGGTAGGRGDMTGCGVMTGFGGGIAAGSIVFCGAGGAGANSTGFEDSFSRFDRAISDSRLAKAAVEVLDVVLCAVGARDQPGGEGNGNSQYYQDDKSDAGFHNFISIGDTT